MKRLVVSWLASLTHDLFALFGHGISVRHLVLILGGVFLLVKGALEIHEMVGGGHDDVSPAARAAVSFDGVIV